MRRSRELRTIWKGIDLLRWSSSRPGSEQDIRVHDFPWGIDATFPDFLRSTTALEVDPDRDPVRKPRFALNSRPRDPEKLRIWLFSREPSGREVGSGAQDAHRW